jgi:peptidyl-tRNA hydrolase
MPFNDTFYPLIEENENEHGRYSHAEPNLVYYIADKPLETAGANIVKAMKYFGVPVKNLIVMCYEISKDPIGTFKVSYPSEMAKIPEDHEALQNLEENLPKDRKECYNRIRISIGEPDEDVKRLKFLKSNFDCGDFYEMREIHMLTDQIRK